VTVTKPDLYRDYLVEQLALLKEDFDVEISVGRSKQEIPFPYVLDGSADAALADVGDGRHRPLFPDHGPGPYRRRNLRRLCSPSEAFPLSLFDGLRTDFSLARLRHYTGAPVAHVQSLCPVHQLPPLRRRVRPLGLRPAARSGQPL
jgi:AMP nucleosidase